MNETKQYHFLLLFAACLAVALVVTAWLDAPGFPLPVFSKLEEQTQPGSAALSTYYLDTVQVVDLNTATLEELDALPGVGPVTAQEILALREELGGFTSLTQLRQVERIGEKTYQTLLPYLTIGEQIK